MHACAVGEEGSMAFVSRAPVAAWMAVYLTGYSDSLTGFCEPLSPPYRCQTGMKNVWCNHWENIRVGHSVLQEEKDKGAEPTREVFRSCS